MPSLSYTLRGVVLFVVLFTGCQSTCPNHALLGCVLRLKAQRVPFEKNMLNVVFNIATEAKLLRTCRVYSNTMPCFREKIVECGDDRQKRMLEEVGRMLMFICSPFSLQRQRQLIKHQRCISAVLNLPATTECVFEQDSYGPELQQCRSNCALRPSNFLCTMQTWVSEQNVCTLQSLHAKCGPEAASLYEQMQVTVFEPHFPLICDYVNHGVESTIPYNTTTHTPMTLTSATMTTITTTTTTATPLMRTLPVTWTTSMRPTLPVIDVVSALPRATTARPTLRVSNVTMPRIMPSPSRPRSALPKVNAKTKKLLTTQPPRLIAISSNSLPESGQGANFVQSRRPLSMVTTTPGDSAWEIFSLRRRGSHGSAFKKDIDDSFRQDMREFWRKPPLTPMRPSLASAGDEGISRPLPPVPLPTSTPRTIKVINILRRFIPDYLPQLHTILQQVHSGQTLEKAISLHAPSDEPSHTSILTTTSTLPATLATTTPSTTTTTTPPSIVTASPIDNLTMAMTEIEETTTPTTTTPLFTSTTAETTTRNASAPPVFAAAPARFATLPTLSGVPQLVTLSSSSEPAFPVANLPSALPSPKPTPTFSFSAQPLPEFHPHPAAHPSGGQNNSPTFPMIGSTSRILHVLPFTVQTSPPQPFSLPQVASSHKQPLSSLPISPHFAPSYQMPSTALPIIANSQSFPARQLYSQSLPLAIPADSPRIVFAAPALQPLPTRPPIDPSAYTFSYPVRLHRRMNGKRNDRWRPWYLGGPGLFSK